MPDVLIVDVLLSHGPMVFALRLLKCYQELINIELLDRQLCGDGVGVGWVIGLGLEIGLGLGLGLGV
ncbi:MAG: hypothetical protein QGH53_01190 [Prochlorococcaceae cyanobacterium ETNP18_MAG_1]|nr:hypothetical protein [Prochlorococcaceae cyanobacterium ETNP18_MAG_1]